MEWDTSWDFFQYSSLSLTFLISRRNELIVSIDSIGFQSIEALNH